MLFWKAALDTQGPGASMGPRAIPMLTQTLCQGGNIPKAQLSSGNSL